MENYRITKESIKGTIKKLNIIKMAGIVTTIGVITSCSLFSNSKEGTYEYDNQYVTYSNQLESMLNVDINDTDASLLDSLQDYRKTIADYKMSDPAGKNQAFNIIADNQDKMVDTCLNIAKTSLSKENGGTIDEWTISFEKTDAVWHAVKKGEVAITLDGEDDRLVTAIGNVQHYHSKEEIEDIAKYIDDCDIMLEEAGKVIVEKSTKSK